MTYRTSTNNQLATVVGSINFPPGIYPEGNFNHLIYPIKISILRVYLNLVTIIKQGITSG